MAKKTKTEQQEPNSLDQNRGVILNLLTLKSALKQDVADDSEKIPRQQHRPRTTPRAPGHLIQTQCPFKILA